VASILNEVMCLYNEGMVNVYCPWGTIRLPIDLWYCKLTDDVCPIQADINTGEWEQFHKFCRAWPERQQEIRQTIETGRYDGRHHAVGKYYCPRCSDKLKGKESQLKALHYEWELEDLRLYVLYDERTLRVELLKRHIPLYVASSSLCRNCLNEVLSKLGLPTIEFGQGAFT